MYPCSLIPPRFTFYKSATPHYTIFYRKIQKLIEKSILKNYFFFLLQNVKAVIKILDFMKYVNINVNKL